MKKPKKCPRCEGRGTRRVISGYDGNTIRWEVRPCEACQKPEPAPQAAKSWPSMNV